VAKDVAEEVERGEAVGEGAQNVALMKTRTTKELGCGGFETMMEQAGSTAVDLGEEGDEGLDGVLGGEGGARQKGRAWPRARRDAREGVEESLTQDLVVGVGEVELDDS